MIAALSAKIHHVVYAIALTIVGLAATAAFVFVDLHRPPASAQMPPVATSSTESRIDRIERELEAVTFAAPRSLAASDGSVPAYAVPAVTVVRDVPGLSGFSPAQVAQILAGLKAPSVTKIGANLVGPKPKSAPTAPPGWTDAQIGAMSDADVAAIEKVLADPQTHIAVTVTQEERAPTRVGSMFTPDGSGLAFAAARRGRFEIDLGAIVRGSHLSPALQPAYLIPHTSVAVGPFVGYDRQLLYGLAATVHF